MSEYSDLHFKKFIQTNGSDKKVDWTDVDVLPNINIGK